MAQFREWLADSSSIALVLSPLNPSDPDSTSTEAILAFFPKQGKTAYVDLSQHQIHLAEPIVLLKEKPFALSCLIPGLYSQDKVEITISLCMILFLDVESIKSLQCFWAKFCSQTNLVDGALIFDAIYGEVKHYLSNLLSAYAYAKLSNPSVQAMFQQKFMTQLPSIMSQYGLGCMKLENFILQAQCTHEPTASQSLIFGNAHGPQAAPSASFEHTDYLLLIAGNHAFSHSLIPKTSLPEQLFDLPKDEKLDIASLGLQRPRAIRRCWMDGKAYSAIGSSDGVALYSHTLPPQIFRFPKEPRSAQGYNAVVVVGEFIYATHSEYGLVCWNRKDFLNTGFVVHPELTERWHTVRCLENDQSTLYFAIDSMIIAMDTQSQDRAILQTYVGSSAEITSFCITADEIFAGNSKGQILRWPKESSTMTATPACWLQTEHPILMLRKIKRTADEFVIACQENGALVFSSHDAKPIRYLADVSIAWVAGSDHWIIGVAQGLNDILFWSKTEPNAKPMQIHSESEIQDIILA